MSDITSTAIKALILDQFSDDYPASQIYLNYQNNNVRPVDNKFIVMNPLSIKHMFATPVMQYDTTLEKMNYQNINGLDYQIDFYSEYKDTTASDTANTFFLLLDWYADDFFYINNYDCSIFEVKDIKNLTYVVDSGMYIERYAVLFSIFYNNSVDISTPGTNDIKVDIYGF